MKLDIKYIFVLLSYASIVSAQDLVTNDKPLPCLNKNYNVYVHVTMNGSGQTGVSISEIEDNLKAVSEAFAPICISFNLCRVDTIPNPKFNFINSTLEVVEARNLYQVENRINLFLMSGYFTPSTCSVSSQNNANNPDNSNLFFLKSCTETTYIHEFGHFFGLFDTWGSRTELVDGSNCDTTEDFVCDTPADPYVAGDDLGYYINPECEFIYTLEKDANGDWYQPDVGNYMGPYPCKCGFTRGQYLRMAEIYENSELKNW